MLQENEVSDEVSKQVAVTKAKLAALEFQRNEERKRRTAKQAKADRVKEKHKRPVHAKISSTVRSYLSSHFTTLSHAACQENVYVVKNACNGCGEAMYDAVPFQVRCTLQVTSIAVLVFMCPFAVQRQTILFPGVPTDCYERGGRKSGTHIMD